MLYNVLFSQALPITLSISSWGKLWEQQFLKQAHVLFVGKSQLFNDNICESSWNKALLGEISEEESQPYKSGAWTGKLLCGLPCCSPAGF